MLITKAKLQDSFVVIKLLSSNGKKSSENQDICSFKNRRCYQPAV